MWNVVLTIQMRTGSQRIQRSLKTTNVAKARQRRDDLIDQLIEQDRVVFLRARNP
jgi:hypothetical protein